MSQELLYTSAPQGLKPGSHGFCTVACTQGMPGNLTQRLESLSGYKHLFVPPDPQTALNPVAWSHLKIAVADRRYHVLSRIGAAGLDHTQRTNHLAHHVVLEAEELPRAGPSWLLTLPSLMQTEWDGQVGLLQSGRTIPRGDTQPAVCRHWEQLTGDAGWGGVLAETAVNNPRTLVTVLFNPGMDVLPLVAESLSLLTPDQRWKVTFSTYYTRLPPDIECQWRFVVTGSAEADAAHRTAGMRVIDLTSELGAPPSSRFVDAARAGTSTFRSALPPPLPPPLPRRPTTSSEPNEGEASDFCDGDHRIAPRPVSYSGLTNDLPDRSAPPELPNAIRNHGARRFPITVTIGTAMLLLIAVSLAAYQFTPDRSKSITSNVNRRSSPSPTEAILQKPVDAKSTAEGVSNAPIDTIPVDQRTKGPRNEPVGAESAWENPEAIEPNRSTAPQRTESVDSNGTSQTGATPQSDNTDSLSDESTDVTAQLIDSVPQHFDLGSHQADVVTIASGVWNRRKDWQLRLFGADLQTNQNPCLEIEPLGPTTPRDKDTAMIWKVLPSSGAPASASPEPSEIAHVILDKSGFRIKRIARFASLHNCILSVRSGDLRADVALRAPDENTEVLPLKSSDSNAFKSPRTVFEQSLDVPSNNQLIVDDIVLSQDSPADIEIHSRAPGVVFIEQKEDDNIRNRYKIEIIAQINAGKVRIVLNLFIDSTAFDNSNENAGKPPNNRTSEYKSVTRQFFTAPIASFNNRQKDIAESVMKVLNEAATKSEQVRFDPGKHDQAIEFARDTLQRRGIRPDLPVRLKPQIDRYDQLSESRRQFESRRRMAESLFGPHSPYSLSATVYVKAKDGKAPHTEQKLTLLKLGCTGTPATSPANE